MSTDQFFAEFPTITKDAWVEKVKKDLKGADFNEKMVWHTEEGFDLDPFYTLGEKSNFEYLKKAEQAVYNPDKAQYANRSWQNRQYIAVIDAKQANKSALIALNAGTDSLFFDLTNVETSTVDLDSLLNEVKLEYCSVSFSVSEGLLDFVERLLTYVEKTGQSPECLQGSVFSPNTTLEEQANLLKAASQAQSLHSWVFSTVTTDKITEKVSGLLTQLSKGLATLTKQGFENSDLVSTLEVRYALGSSYFPEIAGMRAFRILAAEIIKEYGLTNFLPSQLFIHASTSILVNDTTKEDPYQNMLSNTTQAMAAILGGCNALSILTHNQGLGEVDEFALRIARNVSTILKEEAYFDKVVDPVAGSYYLEALTDKIAEKSWELFQANS